MTPCTGDRPLFDGFGDTGVPDGALEPEHRRGVEDVSAALRRSLHLVGRGLRVEPRRLRPQLTGFGVVMM